MDKNKLSLKDNDGIVYSKRNQHIISKTGVNCINPSEHMSSTNVVEKKNDTPYVGIISADEYKEDAKNLALVKKISVVYDYSDKDNYSLSFEYNRDGTMNKMEHLFTSYSVKQKEVYEIISNRITFYSYKSTNNEWIINTKNKNYEYTQSGLISKKTINLDINQSIMYKFSYNGRLLNEMECLINDAKEELNKYHGLTSFIWGRNNLLSFHTNRDVDGKMKNPYIEEMSFIYTSIVNKSNIDFNYLLVGGDLKPNIEGCIGLLGNKMPNVIYYDQESYDMHNGHYEYTLNDDGLITDIVYKMKTGSRLRGVENVDWKWRTYMKMKIEY